MSLGLILVVIALFFIYLALVRPQRRKQNEQVHMWQELAPGDEVVTAGGIYGEIVGFRDDDVVVEIAPDIEVRVARRAIAGVVPAEEEGDELEESDEDEHAELTPEEAESYPGVER